MKKDHSLLDKLKKIPKNQFLIGGLVGILLLVIAIPVENREEKSREEQRIQTREETSYDTSIDYGKRLERRLEQVLENMEGVGKVKVMITLQDEGEHVVEKEARTARTYLRRMGTQSGRLGSASFRRRPFILRKTVAAGSRLYGGKWRPGWRACLWWRREVRTQRQ